ncbi:hypothetical protein [Desulfoferrobacter suflitae]|uniref:hypothetical protein n=1 Tax=Desulfoferrobacter suflitae TaxID=2865782 RepID=UPI0021641A04|nr:hypothetical protein [Desulfoferrobacter suflitae]MCK8601551.1 hypothetical protein [Desulfoferrobacter suflitae]
MPQLPKFMRGGRIDYFGRKRIKKDVALFIEDLNFWLDRVFVYQKNRTTREAERFLRQLAEGVNGELFSMIQDPAPECDRGPTTQASLRAHRRS